MLNTDAISRQADATGQVFGRYTVKGFAGRNQWQQAMWWCECTCGNLKAVRWQVLAEGKAKSCGDCVARMSDDEFTAMLKAKLNSYLVSSPGGCMVWTGGKISSGYGEIRVRGGWKCTHIVAYSLFKGPISAGLFVCHSCDNRLCCNPDHLFLGTHDDNMRDKIAKGRQAKGERHGHAKLTDHAVREARQLYRVGDVTLTELAEKYKVHQGTIRHAVVGRTWRHVKDD